MVAKNFLRRARLSGLDAARERICKNTHSARAADCPDHYRDPLGRRACRARRAYRGDAHGRGENPVAAIFRCDSPAGGRYVSPHERASARFFVFPLLDETLSLLHSGIIVLKGARVFVVAGVLIGFRAGGH